MKLLPSNSKNAAKKSLSLLLALLLAVSPLMTLTVQAEEYEPALPLVGNSTDTDGQPGTEDQINTDDSFNEDEASGKGDSSVEDENKNDEESFSGNDSSFGEDGQSGAVNYEDDIAASSPSIGTFAATLMLLIYSGSDYGDTRFGNVTISPPTAEVGESVTLTFLPADGCKLGALYISGLSDVDLNDVVDNKYTFEVTLSMMGVMATFVEIPKEYAVPEDIDGVYQLKTAEHLLWLSEQCKTNSTINAILVNDIDASGIDWVPIGTTNGSAYKGEFDGNDKTVTINYVASSADYNGHGLFGVIGAGANVHDLTVAGSVAIASTLTSSVNIGAIAGRMTGGTVSNVTNTASVTGNANATIGGIIGIMTAGTVGDAVNAAAVTSAGANTGGVVGSMSGGEVSNAVNAAAVTGTGANTGGIAGAVSNGTLSNALHSGAVTGSGNYTAGIVAALSGSGIIDSALCEGTVKTTNVSTTGYLGGIVAQMQNGQILSSVNETDIIAECRYVAGISAIVSGGTLTNNTNNGVVTNNSSATPYIGGITSYLSSAVVSFGGNVNRGKVSAIIISAANVGSLIGYTNAQVNRFTSSSYYELGGLKPVGNTSYALDDVLVGFLPAGVTEYAVKKTDPVKVTYRAGDLFDPAGITVTLTTSDGSGSIDATTTILGVESVIGWDKKGELTTDDSEVVVQFTAEGLSAPISITVTIKVIDAGDLTGLRIATQPVKKMYTEGESFDKNDIALRAVYGTVEIVLLPDEWTVTPAVFGEGDTKITISYGGIDVEIKDFTILLGSVPQIDEDGSYLLGTQKELLWFAGYATVYPNSKARLINDIDMAGIKWTPIGEPLTGSVKAFTGIFDGNGKVVSNVSIVERHGSLGFFASIDGATIKDLALTGLVINSLSTAGGVGGIAASAGRSNISTISGCYISCSITSGGLSAGGILGTSTIGVNIENCRVDGSIKATYQIGGLIGWYNAGASPLNVRNCIITASITGTLDDGNGNAYVGGLIGNRTNSNGVMSIVDTRILSEKITSINGVTTGAIYGGGSTGTFTLSDVTAWKGLLFLGTPLKNILYGDALFSEARNGATVLSWKLATSDGWPATFNGGAWSYSEGKLPVLTQFAGVMSGELPAYMSDYLVNPGVVDASELTAFVQKMDALVQAEYSDGWEDFRLNLTKVKRVLADDESSQAELDAAQAEIEEAFALLDARNSIVLTGAGTAEDPYLIANLDQLLKIDRIINSNDIQFRASYYKLTDDIDMAGQKWVPLGGNSAATAFTGGFDGNGKTISNLTMSGGSRLGMFGFISGAKIENLTLADCKISCGADGDRVAGLVAESEGHSYITNCHVSGEIEGISNTAGLVSRIGTSGSITIKNCSVSGSVHGELINGYSGGSYIGGYIAWIQGGAGSVITIEDCTMSADVYGGANYTGGIIGYMTANNTIVIRNCDVILSDTANITGNRWVGGITANSVANTGTASMTIENCTVTGGRVQSLTTTISSETGGLIGEIPNNGVVRITDCYVETDVLGSCDKVGGLVGVKSGASGALTITRCAYNGTVTGANYVGGLVGYGTNLTITDCYAGGQMTGTDSVGGLLGYKLLGGNTAITNSYTTASLQGRAYVGGVIGQQISIDTSTFKATGVRALGQTITRQRLSENTTFGALSGDALYATSYYSLTDAYAWTGMMLVGNTLSSIEKGDVFYDTWRNGTGFLSWSLKTAEGWPAAISNNEGAWSYTAGRLPVLTKFADRMIDALPGYLADIPAGTLGDKTVLRAIIAEAEAMSSAVYSAESVVWADVQEKLTIAREIENLYDAAQSLIDTVEAALTGAVKELKRLTDITFGGSGTIDEPYEISKIDQLMKLNRLVNSPDAATRNVYRAAHYKLTADIDMSGVSWSPLGGTAAATAFTGSFDGDGNTLSNMTLSGETCLGFFGYVSGATIKNLTVRDFELTGIGLNNLNNMGAISAWSASSTTITNCHAIGKINSKGSYLGGITGRIDGRISDCTAEIDLLSTADNGGSIGGITGALSNGVVENCSMSGKIECRATWQGETGGIVGNIDAGANAAIIENCVVRASIVGVSVGGILGVGTSNGTVSDRVVVSNCYFDGVLSPAYTTVTVFMGGIAGRMLNNVKITDCRSDGTISMASVAGGIVGRFGGMLAGNSSINNCYTTMRIGNGGIAGGIVGDFVTQSVNATGKLIITDTLALNELISAETTANAIHAFGEDSSRLDYTLSGVKVWAGILVRENGVTQAVPENAVSHVELLTASGWAETFKSAPWSFTAGKLPVLASMSGAGGDFPAYMTGAATPKEIADTKELLEHINAANALVKATYTAESWAKLTTAVTAATALLRSAQATQSEVGAAMEAVQTAIDNLEIYIVPTTLAGEGTAESPFLVGSAEDYEEMSRLLVVSNFYRQAHYRLTSDIDLLGEIRSPMPYTTATAITEMAFAGDFDGGGFTISNLRIEHSWATGMFGYTDGAAIHDFTLANCDIYGAISNTGAIAGYARNTLFENININGRVEGSTNLGGMVGSGMSSTIKNCHFEGVVDTHNNTSANSIGGLCGSFYSLIEDSSVKGKINYNGISLSYLSMGGLVGSGSGDIRRCTVEADINYKYNTGDGTVNNGPEVGGIVGVFSGNSIVDCHFTGRIDARGAGVGGIVGDFRGLLIQGCTSEGELNMNWPSNSSQGDRRPAGGIVGIITTGTDRNVVIDDCISSMDINGFREAGGIAGSAVGSGSITISNSQALNGEINNSRSDFHVDPFFFGSDTFSGEYKAENNYISEDMKINGRELSGWMNDTMTEKYDGSGFMFGPVPAEPAEPGPGPGPGPAPAPGPDTSQLSGDSGAGYSPYQPVPAETLPAVTPPAVTLPDNQTPAGSFTPTPNPSEQITIQPPAGSSGNVDQAIRRPTPMTEPVVNIASGTADSLILDESSAVTEDSTEKIEDEKPPLANEPAPALADITPTEIAREAAKGISPFIIVLSAIVIIGLGGGGFLFYRRRSGSKSA